MIDLKITITDNTAAVLLAAERGTEQAVARTAYDIRLDAVNSIAESASPSRPGSPPHTRRDRRLPRSIAYAADGGSAVIGPRASIVGEVGGAHERGETFRGTNYEPRPFMGPALERNISVFGDNFTGSIGS